MSIQRLSSDVISDYTNVAASTYTYQELADIYNQTRVDYIVPMPMNGKRMEEYVNWYDIDLKASIVTLNGHSQIAALGMLGIRDTRGWITRLGVIPERRGRKMGLFAMETLLEHAIESGVCQVQLEVIHGNEPARHLFEKLGFVEARDILVLRRPPMPVEVTAPDGTFQKLDQSEIVSNLQHMATTDDHDETWLHEPASLLNAGNLDGFSVTLDSGATGWLIFRQSVFQVSHIVLHTPVTQTYEVALALLHHLHTHHPKQDTKQENVPVGGPLAAAFAAVGYGEVFARTEMVLSLG